MILPWADGSPLETMWVLIAKESQNEGNILRLACRNPDGCARGTVQLIAASLIPLLPTTPMHNHFTPHALMEGGVLSYIVLCAARLLQPTVGQQRTSLVCVHQTDHLLAAFEKAHNDHLSNTRSVSVLSAALMKQVVGSFALCQGILDESQWARAVPVESIKRCAKLVVLLREDDKSTDYCVAEVLASTGAAKKLDPLQEHKPAPKTDKVVVLLGRVLRWMQQDGHAQEVLSALADHDARTPALWDDLVERCAKKCKLAEAIKPATKLVCAAAECGKLAPGRRDTESGMFALFNALSLMTGSNQTAQEWFFRSLDARHWVLDMLCAVACNVAVGKHDPNSPTHEDFGRGLRIALGI